MTAAGLFLLVMVSIKPWIFLPLAAAWLVPVADESNLEKDYAILGGAEVLDDRCVRLTPDARWASGSAWAKAPVNLDEPFDVEVSLRFGNKDGLGADGIVFVLTTSPRTGWRGEGIGFAGLRNAVGIELDTYQNRHRGDPAADHLALLLNGVVHRNGSHVVEVGNLEDGRAHALRVTWTPKAKTLAVALDGERVATFPGAAVRDRLGAGPVYWGFTAATGRKTNAHDVCVADRAVAAPASGWWSWLFSAR